MALRHGQNHAVGAGPGVEFRRAHQISHIFQHHQIQLTRLQIFQALASHGSIQVAHTAGVELDGLHAGGQNGLGIHIRVDVRLHHRNPQPILQCSNQSRQGSGLAGTGRGHEIQQKYLLLPQLLAQGLGLGIVVGEYALLDFDNADILHRNAPLLSGPTSIFRWIQYKTIEYFCQRSFPLSAFYPGNIP